MIIKTPVGLMTVGFRNGSLVCEFGKQTCDTEPPTQLTKQLTAYFKGTFTDAFDAPLPEGSPFSKKCWTACRTIPFGTTITYSQLANLAGSPKAARAAGQAMRHNPVAILTPCHRVISSSGKLHGYSGVTNPRSKELYRKQFLINLEKCIMKS